MEVKKSQKADLEGKKSLFLEIGLVTSLLLMIGAFAWGQGKREVQEVEAPIEEFAQEEIIENTVQDTPVPQVPTPATVMSVIAEDIVIVDNNTEIETTQVFADVKDNQGVGPSNAVEVAVTEPDFWVKVEVMPKFQGGDLTKFQKWVSSRIRYPETAQQMGIQGTVRVQFIVNPDGSLSDFEVVSNTDPLLNNEALRVVKQSPKWTPGRQATRAVRVRIAVPVSFRIA